MGIRLRPKDIREFFRALLPTEPHFSKRPTTFRGQADATWGLVPSLWRRDAWNALGGPQRHGLTVSATNSALIENGLAVKDAGREIRRLLSNVFHRVGLPPLDPDGEEAAALARHLGLPSHLLDMTRSPLIAAYFAAADAVRMDKADGDLVIYTMTDTFRNMSRHLANTSNPQVPGFGNPFLVAQQGQFIGLNGTKIDLLEGQTFVDVQVGQRMTNPPTMLDEQIAQIVFPRKCAPTILLFLRDQGIHAGSMFPGHVGATELTRELLRTN